ncbi:diablo homolog, mitochondrial-like [Plectropomus leopardus]|uniref:diablo homolog, mitochondrial-like n=1 Tax=Plectropomus leopardus TaxID=160734 RepID=UPI001C4B0BDC|nr:diablo homolog, mitochondrial-like [Plectropomus leopardus]XP_042343370.1 diablo homolog, mitochondrial-like [Plectropomus leopardus]XP_042343371.1 diablo homolog, mitochondrial-like [Plectropomus leopardus]
MAALRSATTCFRLLRSSARVLFRIPAVHKPGKWTNILYKSIASLTVGGGLCAVPFKQVENLSHDSLIRRAASLVTDSSSTFLSQTTLGLIDAITEYSKAVHTLIALQRRYLDSIGKLTPAEEDTIWQVIIGQRSEVNDRQDECKRFESTWMSAVKLCETAAEAAYSSGAEHACITVRTNIQVALSQVEEAQKLSADADKKLAEAKVMEIERVAQYAASLENNSDEEEVPEAYLRED